MDILRELSDQHLSCSICMDEYIDPKQLPCLHSFCTKCLATHILKTVGGSGGVSFQCPVCRKVCKPENPDPRKVLEWVDSFPDNFYIKSLIDTFKAQQRDAAPVPVEDQLKSMSVEAETCPKHRKEMVVSYCVLKNLGVCGVCLKSSSHDNCNKSHLTPEEARKYAGERLQNFKRRIEALSSRVESTEAKLAARPDELKFKKGELAIEISQYFSELKTQVNKILLVKEKEALEEMKEVIKSENAKVAEARDETKSLSGSLTSTEQLFDKLMENRPVGALSVAETVENQIAAYENATSKVESAWKKLDISLNRRDDIGHIFKNMCFGNIHVGGEAESAGRGQLNLTNHSLEPNQTSELTGQAMLPARSDRASDMDHLTSVKLVTSNNSTDERTPGNNRLSADHLQAQQQEPKPQTQPKSSFLEQSSSSLTSPHSGTGAVGGQRSPRNGPPDPLQLPAMTNSSQIQEAASMLVCQQSQSNFADNMSVSLQLSQQEPSLSLPISESQSITSNTGREFRLSFLQDFDGLCPPGDTHPASYVGVCPFDQNCLIIVDRWNKKLKLVQIGGRILLFLEFPDQMEPWDVTPVSDDKVAVTCPGYSHILMIEVSNTSMKICRYIKTLAGYSSLVHLDANRFAAGVCKPFGPPHVDILDASSSQATVLMKLPSFLTYPRTLDLTKDRNLLICDWSQKEVCVFDSGDFRPLLRYKGAGRDAALREPVGATKDRRGNLYVLDRKTKKIHVLSSESGNMSAILSLNVPSDPKVVVIVEAERSYSSGGEVLVVALGNGKLFVYDLITP